MLNSLSVGAASYTQAIGPRPNFPRTEPASIDFSSPAVFDLDGDGVKEILTSDALGCIWGWDAQGNLLPGFPYMPAGRCASRNRINSPLAIGDVDGDGDLEIVAGSSGRGEADGERGKVFVLNTDGTHLPGWPQEMRWNFTVGSGHPEVYSVLLADVVGDSRPEVVAGTSNNSSSGGAIDDPTHNLFVWNASGRLLPGFPTQYRRAGIYGQIAAGNVIRDHFMEIVAPRDHRWLHLYDSSGQYPQGWPVETYVDMNKMAADPYLEFTRNAPVVADLEGDGQVEIIAAGRVKESEQLTNGAIVIINSGVLVFEPDGTRKPGWEIAKLGDGPPLADSFGPSQAPALGDLNRDGKLEIVVTQTEGTLRVYRYTGELMWKYDYAQGEAAFASEPVLGDITGDGYSEIIFGVYSPDGTAVSVVGIYALDAKGKLLEGFPLKLSAEDDPDRLGIRAAPTLADLEGDGRVEIFAASWSGSLYVWDTPGLAHPAFMPWPTGRQNLQRTGSIERKPLFRSITQPRFPNFR